METLNIKYLTMENARGEPLRIAYESYTAPANGKTGLVWLPGLMSTMTSTKVTALRNWCQRTGHSFVRFDYSGHGTSEGKFTDGTIGQWLTESLNILRNVANGPQVLVGSSMGAWLVLLILQALAHDDEMVTGICPIEGAVLIAPAWDMTEELMWKKFAPEVRDELDRKGFYERPSRYDDGPYVITKQLIEEGRSHLLAGENFTPTCPVRIIHGIEDPDVPWLHANKLTHMLDGDDVMLSLIHDGDHRLSRPRDIDTILFIIDDLFRHISKERTVML